MEEVANPGEGSGGGGGGWVLAYKGVHKVQEGRWTDDPPGEGQGESVATLTAARHSPGLGGWPSVAVAVGGTLGKRSQIARAISSGSIIAVLACTGAIRGACGQLGCGMGRRGQEEGTAMYWEAAGKGDGWEWQEVPLGGQRGAVGSWGRLKWRAYPGAGLGV